MIKIVTERGPSKDLSSILDPVKSIEGIPEMQHAIRVLQGYIQRSGNESLRPLRIGCESVYYALWPLTNLTLLRRQTNLWIEERDTSDGKCPILTIADFRKWLLDDLISWSGDDSIEATMNYLTEKGKSALMPIFNHTEAEEINYANPKVGYAEVDLKGNPIVLKDLIAQGTKGGPYNAYGPFEKLLGIMLWCTEFPQSGKAGAGDLKVDGELVEVKSCNGDSLKSNCIIPSGGSLLLVRGNITKIEVLCFRNQKILNKVLRKGEMYSARPNKDTGKRELLPNKINLAAVKKLFINKGTLNRNYLKNAGYGPNNSPTENEPPEDVSVDDASVDDDSIDIEDR